MPPEKPDLPRNEGNNPSGASPPPMAADIFAKAFAINPAAIAITRLDDGRIIEVNEGWQTMFGYSRDEARGRSAISLIWPRSEDRDLFVQELREKGSFSGHERTLLRKSGESFVALGSAEIMDIAGESLVVSTWLDISEWKMAKSALRETEEKYRSIVETTHDGIMMVDHGRKIIFVNQQAAGILGYTPEELAGKKTDDFFVEKQQLFKSREKLDKGGRAYGEFQLRRKDGRIIYAQLNVASILDADARHVANLAMLKDITQRKRAEVELKQSSARLDWVLKKTGVGIWLSDLTSGLLKWDEQNKRLFFIPPDVEPTLELFWSRIHPDDRESTQLSIERAIRDHTLHEMDHRTVNPETGEIRWIHSIGQATYTADRTSVRFDGMNFDITARKRAEDALQQANADLERRVEERTVELVQLTAQLRALAAELTLSEQRERRRLAEVLHDHLQQLLVAAKFPLAAISDHSDPVVQRAGRKVDQLLDDSIELSHSLTSELDQPILHEGGLTAGLDWLARWMADRHGLVVDLSMEEDFPPLAEAAKVLLFTSVRELLFNAIKHAHAMAASVNLHRLEDGQLRITVSDNGSGFDPDKLKKVGVTGAGFGLFSIRERLNILGGHMEIESSPGKGSRFMLTVPLSEVVEPELPAVPLAMAQAADRRIILKEFGTTIRVLLADNHAVMREGLTELLERFPEIEILGAAADGQEAVEMAARLLPDIILMDVTMPKLNGVEATRAIVNAHPDIRIIGLSMFEEKEWAQAMLDAGAVNYLTKTSPSAELINAIRKCMVG